MLSVACPEREELRISLISTLMTTHLFLLILSIPLASTLQSIPRLCFSYSDFSLFSLKILLREHIYRYTHLSCMFVLLTHFSLIPQHYSYYEMPSLHSFPVFPSNCHWVSVSILFDHSQPSNQPLSTCRSSLSHAS